jgi:AcrR family transcriptional regulator
MRIVPLEYDTEDSVGIELSTASVPIQDRSPRAPEGGPRSRSRRAILDATADLLRELGYADLAIEAVASRARIAKTTIYRWWPTKPALVLSALEDLGTFAPPPRTGDLETDLAAAVHTARANTPGASALGSVLPALAIDILAHPELRKRFHQLLEPRREATRRAIQRGGQTGQLPADIDADLLIDIYAGTLMYRALINGVGTDEHRIATLLDLLLHGRLPRQPPNDQDQQP